MHHSIRTVAVFLVLVLVGAISVVTAAPMNFALPLASVFFSKSVTNEGLQKQYAEALRTKEKVKILLVPGHEPDFGGAEFRNLKERDMAVDLGRELALYLKDDPHYEVFTTRNKDLWDPVLERYFREHWVAIKNFVGNQKIQMERLVREGRLQEVGDAVPHNEAPDEVALRLYGINQWANEQGVDIVLHLHFNDSSPRPLSRPGEYSGFTIYVPEKQYSNAAASKLLAGQIFRRILGFAPVSNLPIEDQGVVEDQDLIAVGSNNTLNGASVLIEYGYIYEPQFANPVVQKLVLKELAFQTYLGLTDFLTGKVGGTRASGATLLPYRWTTTLTKTTRANPDVLAVQVALLREGLYPPIGSTKNECPLSGVYGPCTHRAVAAFQERFAIPGNGTIIGVKTRAKLNELYGAGERNGK